MKKINEKFIAFLIMELIVNHQQVNAFPVMLVVGVVQFAWSAFEMLNTVHDTYSKFTTPSTADLLEKSEELTRSVEKWGGRIELKIDQTVNTLLTRLPLKGTITQDLRLLNTYIGRIDELYSDMSEYIKYPEKFTNRALGDLIKSFISRDGDDLQGSIAQMHSLIVPQGLGRMKKSLFLLLAEETRENELSLCGIGASPQGRLIDLFDIAMESEMRAFAMMGFGYMMDGYMKNVTLKGGMTMALNKLITRSKQYANVLKYTMTLASRRFRRCDPLRHERGVTYFEFEKFIQSAVLMESVMWLGNCRGCYLNPRITEIANHGCYGIGCDNKDSDTCMSRVRECESMNSWAAVCYYSKEHSRRYEWFADGNGNVYGDNQYSCPTNVTIATKVGACDVCKCICVEDGFRSTKSNHFISLREQVTDINNNMVAVGLTFVIVNRMLHLKILQGKLEPRGEIVGNSTNWVELEDIQYHQEKSKRIWRDNFIKKSEGSNDEIMIKGKDFFILRWEDRSIGLDTMSLPTGYLLTGVRFNHFAGVVQLEIQGTRFDYETGMLTPDSSIWITPYDMPITKKKKIREEYKMKGFVSPTKSSQTHIDSSPFTFVNLYATSVKDDAGQTTVPLLDSIPVISDPPAPLVGAGLYYKAESSYAGFLTLVLEGLDKSPYLTVE